MTLVAGIDSSTQSCKVVIRDLDTGAVVRTGRAGHPSGTEVDPEAWWVALQTAIADAGGFDDVAAVSVGGQQHGMVVLDDGGRVIRNALLWNDTRSAQAALDLIAEVGAADFAARTGCVPVASFTITKLRWLADAEPQNAARVAAVALPHDWLTWRLRGFGPDNPQLGELTTDRSDASGTSYFNPSTNEYDLALLGLALRRPVGDAGLEPSVILPRIVAPGEVAGHISGTQVALAAGAGDNAAAALGLGAVPGDVVISIGTSGTVFAVTDTAPRDESGTVAGFADASGAYLPLIATLNAARVLDSIAGLLGVDHTELGSLALTAEPGSDGAVLQPYFEGERTPNLPDATATLFGMTLLSTTRPNLARAAIEGLLCGLADGLDAVRAQGVEATRLLLIGGAAQNSAVSAIAAQVFEVPVVVPEPGEYVAAGAAVQAAWAVTGSRPTWTIAEVAAPAVDYRPVIRQQYAARAAS
ncbi:xylulokinase [Glaciihabitans sp. dw_435]|uniref:xylulokinase n=1 Tax=Glaciihabitans sp. dw_435 TaxID=2720081 RepID=UPI001BD1F9F7|nr:xylulokinase [Glaciihabitans sp. dw_435]